MFFYPLPSSTYRHLDCVKIAFAKSPSPKPDLADTPTTIGSGMSLKMSSSEPPLESSTFSLFSFSFSTSASPPPPPPVRVENLLYPAPNFVDSLDPLLVALEQIELVDGNDRRPRRQVAVLENAAYAEVREFMRDWEQSFLM